MFRGGIMTDLNDESRSREEGEQGFFGRLRGFLGARNDTDTLRDTIEELIELEARSKIQEMSYQTKLNSLAKTESEQKTAHFLKAFSRGKVRKTRESQEKQPKINDLRGSLS